jgi:hypothetical protein
MSTTGSGSKTMAAGGLQPEGQLEVLPHTGRAIDLLQGRRSRQVVEDEGRTRSREGHVAKPVPMWVVTARALWRGARTWSGWSLPHTAWTRGSANHRTICLTVPGRNRLSASVNRTTSPEADAIPRSRARFAAVRLSHETDAALLRQGRDRGRGAVAGAVVHHDDLEAG